MTGDDGIAAPLAVGSANSKVYGAAGEDGLRPSQPRWRVVLLCVVICLATVAEGYDVGVLNGVIVRMKDDLNVSTFEVSLVVSVTPLFVVFGSLLGGAAADSIGRRFALVGTCLVLAAGPLMMAFAPNFSALLLGRSVVGLGIGMGFVVVSMFVTEIAPSELRGSLISCEDLMLNCGILLGYTMNLVLLGVEHDWRIMLGFGAFLPLVLAILLACPGTPESPRWLCLQGRFEEASVVLHKFLAADEADLALRAMREQISGPGGCNVTWQQLLWSSDRSVWRALFSCIAMGVAQVSCGYLVVGYYSSGILASSMSEHAAFMATFLIGCVKLAFVLVVMTILERVGRRPLILISTVGTVASTGILALSFLLRWSPWIQVLSLCLFMAAYSLGQGPLVFVYVSEVLVSELRAKGLSLSFFVSRIFGTMSTLFFPLLAEATSLGNAFLLQTLWNLCMLALLWAIIVESHGRTLEEMASLFHEKP
mmetsp:Transcript_6180/g.10773  ORF Transcript_6180/g.10773 Transcript_6180/m.10773 type:complete len:480 (+) Transcript_6180:28-1467(+)